MELFLTVIAIVLFAGYAVLIIYYRQCWQQIAAYQPTKKPNENGKGIRNENNTTKITIIIPARNEEQHIGRCLQSIIQQTYPVELFEVIVVDDHSTDNTAAIVQSFAKRNIHCIFLRDFVTDNLNSYKKKAIEIAIAQSTGDLIVTTDADCFMGNNWLQTIASFYETYKPAFIAAPVSINCNNRFLAIFQTLDFMTLQGITGASVYKKIHSMCNGANLAYEKTAFNEVGGFKGIDNIASGDDMLLMHKIYKRYPDRVMFLRSEEVIVQTQPVKSMREFFGQRIRWASKAGKYDDKRIFGVLLLVYLFNLMMLGLPVIAIFNNVQYSILHVQCSMITVWGIMFLLKILIELLFLFPVAQFFGKQNMLKLFPFLQPFHILYTVTAGLLGMFGKYNWKGRKVK